MSAISPQEQIPLSIETQVTQLASLLFAIFEACNVNAQLLVQQLATLVEAGPKAHPPSSVWVSADVHLACTNVVFTWRRDPEFLDSDGNARLLPRCGASSSFARLCLRAAPGQPADVLLEYLSNMGGIRREEGDHVRLLTESVLACATQPQHAVAPETVLMHIQGFLGAVEFNLRRREGDPPPRFERACYGEIPSRLVPVFQQLVANRGQNLIDSIDEWLDRHRAEAGSGSDRSRVGAGAYMLVNNSNLLE